jgi:hypothetical protein
MKDAPIQSEARSGPPKPNLNESKQPLIRIGLWLISFLIADVCFSLLFGRNSAQTIPIFFLGTLMFGWPAWCLYLPVVVAFKDAEGRRMWIILSGGILVGPLSLLLWDAAHGGLRDMADTLPVSFMVFAVIVGSLTTCAYVCALRLLHGYAGRAESY